MLLDNKITNDYCSLKGYLNLRASFSPVRVWGTHRFVDTCSPYTYWTKPTITHNNIYVF